MINFDGKCFSSYKSVPEESLSYLNSLPIHTHHLIAFDGEISLLEAHYFSVMAALRRFRVEIPMHYTLDFFQEQTDLLNDFNKNPADVQQLSLKFYRKKRPIKEAVEGSICFLMQAGLFPLENKTLDLTLYKDHYIFANDYSNLFQTNTSLRELGQVFAYENGFKVALLLNNHKRLVESTHGAVFLIQHDGIQTPALSEGTANTVIRSAFIQFLIKECEVQVVETEIAVFSIQQAQEVLLISSAYGFTHIGQFRKKKYEKERSVSLLFQFLNYLKNQL
jgi:branched-chain amino acid aminotransferase